MSHEGGCRQPASCQHLGRSSQPAEPRGMEVCGPPAPWPHGQFSSPSSRTYKWAHNGTVPHRKLREGSGRWGPLGPGRRDLPQEAGGQEDAGGIGVRAGAPSLRSWGVVAPAFQNRGEGSQGEQTGKGGQWGPAGPGLLGVYGCLYLKRVGGLSAGTQGSPQDEPWAGGRGTEQMKSGEAEGRTLDLQAEHCVP